MSDHEPGCDKPGMPADRCKVCSYIRTAYQRGYTAGYNAHVASASHWEATHGAYQQHGQGENP